MACLHDLRDGTDLALRQSASSALERCIAAAAAAPPSADSSDAGPSDVLLPGNLVVGYPRNPLARAAPKPPHNQLGQPLTAAATTTTTAPTHSAAEGDGEGCEEGNPLTHLMPRVLYPQLRSQLAASSLAVRQEHLQLLRALACACPTL
jgi:hypothetical protein